MMHRTAPRNFSLIKAAVLVGLLGLAHVLSAAEDSGSMRANLSDTSVQVLPADADDPCFTVLRGMWPALTCPDQDKLTDL